MKIWKLSKHYDYLVTCHECGNKVNYDKIQKVMGHKVCDICSKKLKKMIS